MGLLHRSARPTKPRPVSEQHPPQSTSRETRSKKKAPKFVVTAAMKENAEAFFEDAIRKGITGLVAEFHSTRTFIPQQCATTQHEANPQKNRYRDVCCLDVSRVPLKPSLHGLPDIENDYIHANYVTGSRKFKQFICTQGPKPNTVGDFWRMVYGEKAPVIVMLCGTHEQGKEKCAQYWPATRDATQTCDGLTVTYSGGYDQKLDENNKLIVSIIKMRPADGEGETLTVKHLLWTTWPDRGVPSHPRTLVSLINLLGKLSVEGRQVPQIIHCSAGIGRTGSVACIERCMGYLRGSTPLDVCETMRLVRSQRMSSVQTETQYVLIYAALLDHIANDYRVPGGDHYAKFKDDYHTFVVQRAAAHHTAVVTGARSVALPPTPK